MGANSKAVIEVYTKNEMRPFLLLSFDLVAAPKELVDKDLFYKFSVELSRNSMLEQRLVQICDVVRQCNPILGVQVRNIVLNKQ